MAANPSPNGTVLKIGQPGVIIDSFGNQWWISAQGAVLVNGLKANYSANVVAIAYVSATVWQENSSSQWYFWNGSNWIAGANPLPDPTLSLLQQLLSEVMAMSVTTTQLTTDVAALTTAVGSFQTSFNNLLAAFQGAGNLTPAQQDAINAADAEIQTTAATLMADTSQATAAVGTASTPSQPPVTTPAPTDPTPPSA